MISPLCWEGYIRPHQPTLEDLVRRRDRPVERSQCGLTVLVHRGGRTVLPAGFLLGTDM